MIDTKIDYCCSEKGWLATVDEDAAPFVTDFIPGMNRNEKQPESCCLRLALWKLATTLAGNSALAIIPPGPCNAIESER